MGLLCTAIQIVQITQHAASLYLIWRTLSLTRSLFRVAGDVTALFVSITPKAKATTTLESDSVDEKKQN